MGCRAHATPYRTNVLYCAKGHLFARAELSMCECREPYGNPSWSGVCEQPDNPTQHVMERGFPRNQFPSPMEGGNKGAPTRQVYASGSYRTHVFLGAEEEEMRQCRTFDIAIA